MAPWKQLWSGAPCVLEQGRRLGSTVVGQVASVGYRAGEAHEAAHAQPQARGHRVPAQPRHNPLLRCWGFETTPCCGVWGLNCCGVLGPGCVCFM